MGDDVVFFDLETQRLFQEVGGRHGIARLGLAVGVVFSARSREFEVYLEDDAAALIERLLTASLVVGFNILRFDYRVLSPYGGDVLQEASSLDLLVEIERELGHRVRLTDLARETLGTVKSSDGLQSVRWFRTGQVDKVIAYCRDDVDLTRQLFEFGLREGRLYFRDFQGRRRSVVASWAQGRFRPGYPAV